MATLDEIFAAMPSAADEAAHEVLYIDPDTREIDVPATEAIFGVESDTQAEKKYFQAPRIVGNGVDLAACFLRVNFRNANGEMDAYLVDDVTVTGDTVTFSWTLSRKVTQYKGLVQFVVCACYPGEGGSISTEWHTTLATGTVLEGMEPDATAAEAATSDVIAQLLALVTRQTAAVEAAGAAQIKAVQTEGAAQVNAVKAAAEAAEADAATAYEPYTGAEYIPEADGNAPGVTSLAPSMTLFTDTAGVTIECEYNRDTNAVVSEILEKIAALTAANNA